MSELLNVEDCELVEWAARVAKAYDRLTVPEQLSLQAWRAAGEPFSSWPAWEQIVGSRPVPLKMKTDEMILRMERAA